MTFSRKTVTVVGWIGVALSAVVALAAAAMVYNDEAGEALVAERMLKNGVVVAATPTYARSSTTTRRRSGSTTTYSIHYAFWDPQMRRFSGTDVATASEYAALTEPGRPATIRAGASVAVVYDRANPSNNGLRSRFESQSSIGWFTVAAVLALALGVGLPVTWAVYAFMKKRAVLLPAPASMPALQPPSVA